jgi:hypothetical protein
MENDWRRDNFCNRVIDIDHAALSVSAFMNSLDNFSRTLKSNKTPLGVKGSGWLAAFPAPNISIKIPETSDAENIGEFGAEEEKESQADESPRRFDFLGKGIDTGFRISKNASEDKFSISVQLAHTLSRAAIKKRFHHTLTFHGRETIKGVVAEIPYPIISIDTERNEQQLELKSREMALNGSKNSSPYTLRDFLETFMNVANIELPYLCFHDEVLLGELPQSYLSYKKGYDANYEVAENRLEDISKIPEEEGLESDVPSENMTFLENIDAGALPEIVVSDGAESGQDDNIQLQ